MLAEELAMNGDKSRSREIDGADDSVVPKREAKRLHAKEDAALPLSDI